MSSSNCADKSLQEDIQQGSSEMNNITTEEASNKVYENISTLQVSLIENMANFLEAKGDCKIDSKLLRSMVEAWSNSITGTTPGSLQDVTMESSYFNYRSPPCISAPQFQGSVSPQGRSVREYDEQMQALRKENFNLRLRMYFIEETLPNLQHLQTSEGNEAIMKELIDTKVEMEMLRREVQEKQEILKDAAQAINQMEQIQKETEIKSQTIIEELKERIQCLELENDMERANAKDLFENPNGSTGSDLLHRAQELETELKSSQDKLREYENKILENCELINKRDITIKEYEEKVKEMVFQNAELLESLENKNAQLDFVERSLRGLRNANADANQEKEKLIAMLKEHRNLYHHEMKNMKRCEIQMDSQQHLLLNLESQKLREELQALKTELADKTCMLLDAEEKLKKREQNYENACLTIQKLMINAKKKNDEIIKLKENKDVCIIRNKSSSDIGNYPEEIETRELSRSLSDTETLKTICNNENKRYEMLIKKPEKRAENLKSDVKMKTIILQKHNEPIISQLHAELREVRVEAEAAEKWRRDCADVCRVLSTRLEELAGFLNTLLKHKEVLGVLANNTEKCNAMRKAVDHSLDLSKSLNRTLSLSEYSIVDHSIAKLNNLSELLADFDNVENKTFNSHEEFCGQHSIEDLRAENYALKIELDKRRIADSKKDRRSQPLQPFDLQSESEAWSEPDRKVSLARIGLEDHSTSYKQSDSDSDSDRKNLNRKTRAQERIIQLEQILANRDERILEIQCQLVEVDNRLKKESLRVIELTNEADKFRNRYNDSCKDMLEKDAQNSNVLSYSYSMLMRDNAEKMYQLEKVQKEKNEIAEELSNAKAYIKTLKSDIDCIKLKHKEALQLAIDEEESKLNELRIKMEKVVQDKLEEQENKHQSELDSKWIARAIYEDCMNQLLQLQKLYNDAQCSIEILNNREQELRLTMVENEHTARLLKKQLDESTLQASKAILERTKAYNDKLLFENQVRDLTQQLNSEKAEKNLLKQRCQHLQKTKSSTQSEPPKSRLSDASQLGYTSEEVLRSISEDKHDAFVQRASNSSPDLGIESDAGRVSSAEVVNVMANTNMNIENKENANNHDENSDKAKNEKNQTGHLRNTVNHDCVKVEQENSELRRKLIRTKRAFEDTYQKLKLANQKKAQIEKDIKNQILKTHNVLKNVRSNMENEL